MTECANIQAPLVNVHTHGVGSGGGVEVITAEIDALGHDLPGHEWLAVGIHPWLTDLADLEARLDWLERQSTLPNVAAIGECGLDRLRGAPLSLQIDVFIRHIRLAERIGKPLIIHCVRAYSELVGLKRRHRVSVPMIVHGYNARASIGAELLAEGFWLSFGGSLLQGRSISAAMLRRVPEDRFFLETDDADLSIQAVYEAAAGIRGVSLDALRASLWKNFRGVFMHER